MGHVRTGLENDVEAPGAWPLAVGERDHIESLSVSGAPNGRYLVALGRKGVAQALRGAVLALGLTTAGAAIAQDAAPRVQMTRPDGYGRTYALIKCGEVSAGFVMLTPGQTCSEMYKTAYFFQTEILKTAVATRTGDTPNGFVRQSDIAVPGSNLRIASFKSRADRFCFIAIYRLTAGDDRLTVAATRALITRQPGQFEADAQAAARALLALTGTCALGPQAHQLTGYAYAGAVALRAAELVYRPDRQALAMAYEAPDEHATRTYQGTVSREYAGNDTYSYGELVFLPRAATPGFAGLTEDIEVGTFGATLADLRAAQAPPRPVPAPRQATAKSKAPKKGGETEVAKLSKAETVDLEVLRRWGGPTCHVTGSGFTGGSYISGVCSGMIFAPQGKSGCAIVSKVTFAQAGYGDRRPESERIDYAHFDVDRCATVNTDGRPGQHGFCAVMSSLKPTGRRKPGAPERPPWQFRPIEESETVRHVQCGEG